MQIFTLVILTLTLPHKSWYSTIIRRLLPDIRFRKQIRDGENTFCIWSPERNYYCYDYSLEMHEITARLPDSDTDFFDIVTAVFSRRYIGTVYV